MRLRWIVLFAILIFALIVVAKWFAATPQAQVPKMEVIGVAADEEPTGDVAPPPVSGESARNPQSIPQIQTAVSPPESELPSWLDTKLGRQAYDKVVESFWAPDILDPVTRTVNFSARDQFRLKIHKGIARVSNHWKTEFTAYVDGKHLTGEIAIQCGDPSAIYDERFRLSDDEFTDTLGYWIQLRLENGETFATFSPAGTTPYIADKVHYLSIDGTAQDIFGYRIGYIMIPYPGEQPARVRILDRNLEWIESHRPVQWDIIEAPQYARMVGISESDRINRNAGE